MFKYGQDINRFVGIMQIASLKIKERRSGLLGIGYAVCSHYFSWQFNCRREIYSIKSLGYIILILQIMVNRLELRHLCALAT